MVPQTSANNGEREGSSMLYKKRRARPRLNWRDERVLDVLHKLASGECKTLGEGRDLINELTGLEISNSTLSRRLQKLYEPNSMSNCVHSQPKQEEDVPVKRSKKEIRDYKNDFLEELDRHGFAPFMSTRATRTLAVLENNDAVRIYSTSHTNADGSIEYYRCSGCYTLRKHRYGTTVANVRLRNGKLYGDIQPSAHNAECKTLTVAQALSLLIDRECRREIRNGITTPRQSWLKGCHKARQYGIEEIFPTWHKLSRMYRAVSQQSRLSSFDHL